MQLIASEMVLRAIDRVPGIAKPAAPALSARPDPIDPKPARLPEETPA